MVERLKGTPWISIAATTAILTSLGMLYWLLWGGQPSGTAEGLASGTIAGFQSHVESRLGHVQIQPVQTLRIRGGSIAWKDGSGPPFLRVSSLAFSVSVPGATSGEIVASNGVIRSPEIHLIKAGGSWNYEKILAPLLNRAGGSGPGAAVTLRDFAVQNGAVTLRMPGGTYRADSLVVALTSARLAGPQVEHPVFQIERAAARLMLPDSSGTVERQIAIRDARLEMANGVQFDIGRLRLGTSTMANASGRWSPSLGGIGLRADIAVTNLQLADIPWLKTEVPEGAHGSAHLAIRPIGAQRTAIAVTDLDLSAPGSHATGSLRAAFGAGGPTLESVDMRVSPLKLSLVEAFTGPLPVGGELQGRIHGTGEQVAFNLQGRLAQGGTGEAFTTNLTGTASVAGGQVQLGQLTAELNQVPLSMLRQFAPGLPVAGAMSGTVTLNGAPGQGPLNLDVRLEAGGGVITVAGMVNLQQPVPSYDLHGRLVGVEMRQLIAPAVPAVQVHGTFQLSGTGLQPEIADATVQVNGGFTGWRSQPGDTLALVAEATHGLLRAQTARVDLGPITLSASGEWRFANGTGGALSYDVAIASLQPLAPYFPADSAGVRPFVTGDVSARGTITGTLQKPAVKGTVQAHDLRYGAWAAGDLSGSYDVRTETALPDVVAKLSGKGIRTPGGGFEAVDLDVDFAEPTLAIVLDATQTGGGVVQFEANGRLDDTGAREILIRKAEMDLHGNRWRLPEPARIAWQEGEAVHVNDLRFQQVKGDGMARVDGVLAPADQTDFNVEIRQLPIGEILALTGSTIPVQGVLSLEGSVQGPTQSPSVSLQLRLDDGSVRGVTVRQITGDVGYGDGRVTFRATGLLGDSARIDVTAAAGAAMTLGLPPSFSLDRSAPVQGHLTTERFPLATLDPGVRTITNIAGQLSADMRLGGTPTAPELGGSMEIRDGAATVPLLDQRYENVEGTATLTGRVVTLHDISVSSGGTAVASGRVTLEELTNPQLDISVQLNGFQPQGVSGENDAGAWGSLAVRGSMTRPTISGDVTLRDGALSLAPVEQASFGQDLLGATQQFDLLQGNLTMAEPATRGFGIDNLHVTAGNDLWFVMKEGRAQLAGTLTIDRSAGDFSIQGRLTGDQGRFTVSAGPGITRQFQLVDATVRFYGGPAPNPSLDITASRTVRTGPNTRVDVRIRVTGTIDNLKVSLASANGGALPQSELLCFLAVGRSCTEVANAGGQSLFGEAAALYGITDVFASRIGPQLGLDYFEIQSRPGASLDQLYVVAGKEIPFLQDFWVNVESPVSGNNIAAYSTVSLEWQFNPSGTLEASYAPPESLRNVTTGRPVPSEYLVSTRQLFIATRWRWTY